MSTATRWWRPSFRASLETPQYAAAMGCPEIVLHPSFFALFGERVGVIALVCAACGRRREWLDFLMRHPGATEQAVSDWAHNPNLCAPCLLARRPLRLRLLAERIV